MPASNTVPRAPFDASAQHARAMIAKINVARHQLAMEEDDYRQLLLDTTGQISLKTCSPQQLEAMIDAMKRKGFRPLPKGAHGRGPRRGAAQHPVAGKARALWISLHHLGVVHNPAEEALEAFAKRQTGSDRMVWMNQSQGYRLIEALKDMATRAGWPQVDPLGKKYSVGQLNVNLCHAILDKLIAAGVAPADWSLATAARRLCGWEGPKDGGWSVEDYVRVAGWLGKVLRDASRGAPRDERGENGHA
jgi:phage gp16-like protein